MSPQVNVRALTDSELINMRNQLLKDIRNGVESARWQLLEVMGELIERNHPSRYDHIDNY